MISFVCDMDACVQRVGQRGKSSGRSEEHEEMARQRYKDFQENSMSLPRELKARALLHKVSVTTCHDIAIELLANTADLGRLRSVARRGLQRG